MPMLFTHDDKGQLTFIKKLDTAEKKETGAVSAMAKFRTLDKQAQSTDDTSTVNTTHKNAIK